MNFRRRSETIAARSRMRGSMSDITLRLQSLHVYPVKSCAGTSPAEAELVETGLDLDRAWMVVDEAGHFVTQRELPRMALVQPQLQGQRHDAARARHAGAARVARPRRGAGAGAGLGRRRRRLRHGRPRAPSGSATSSAGSCAWSVSTPTCGGSRTRAGPARWKRENAVPGRIPVPRGLDGLAGGGEPPARRGRRRGRSTMDALSAEPRARRIDAHDEDHLDEISFDGRRGHGRASSSSSPAAAAPSPTSTRPPPRPAMPWATCWPATGRIRGSSGAHHLRHECRRRGRPRAATGGRCRGTATYAF